MRSNIAGDCIMTQIHESLNEHLMASNDIFIMPLTVRCRVINLYDHDTCDLNIKCIYFDTLKDTLTRASVMN